MTKKDYVTQSDINMIDHFLINRGDISRWVDWEKRKPIIEKEFPGLIAAIDHLEIAEKALNRVAKNIINNSDKYPDE